MPFDEPMSARLESCVTVSLPTLTTIAVAWSADRKVAELRTENRRLNAIVFALNGFRILEPVSGDQPNFRFPPGSSR
jgi:hypothetical protein